jgi:hypothetical protein
MHERSGLFIPGGAPVAELPPWVDTDRRWGVGDTETASSFGYHLPSEIPEPNGDSAIDAYLATLAAAEREQFRLALTGPEVTHAATVRIPGTKLSEQVNNAYSPEGCLGLADSELSGDRNLQLALEQSVDRVRSTVDVAATADKDFQKVMKAWSDCFKSKGYVALDPVDAATRYYTPGERARSEELAAASADVECKQTTDFSHNWNSALDRALTVQESDAATVVTTWLEMKATMLHSAAEVAPR